MGDGRKTTIWFAVGFLVLATVVVIVAAVTSSGSLGGSSTVDTPAPPVAEDDWIKGSADAKVALIEYADFQCPACAFYHPMLKRLAEEYGDQIAIVSRNFPLYSIHPNAGISAQAAEAAGLQGKYWEMHDLLYENQKEWATVATRNVVAERFDGYAQSLSLDMDKFHEDIGSNHVLNRISDDVSEARSVGVNSTPTFYVNQQRLPNPNSYEELKSVVDTILNVPASA